MTKTSKKAPGWVMPTELGRRIRYFRRRLDLTQDELAKRAGLSCLQVISALECEREEPTLNTCRKLAQALGISVSELIGQ